MSVLEVADHVAASKLGQSVAEIPLTVIPQGYYLKRSGSVIVKNADHLWIPHYQSRGFEHLGLVKDITLQDVEACVYLRAIGGITEPVKKARKKRKKKLKKGENA